MLAVVETSDARRPEPGRAVSVSAAVAVHVTGPADRPESARPANSQPTLGARMKVAALAMLSPIAAASTGRRPAWSDVRPEAATAESSPPAHLAKLRVIGVGES